jgi:hypothetical protein
MKKLIGVVGMLVLLGGFVQADEGWLSETPGGPPVTYLYLEPCDSVTLYLVLYPSSATASSINIPIMYDPLVEVVDFDFTIMNFDFLGLCITVLDAWSFFPNHDEVNMYVTWFAYTTTYPTCDVPMGANFDVGWITFHCLGSGQTEIVEGVGPTGMGFLYTNGATAIDYACTWVPLLIEQGSGVKEGGLKDIPKVPFLANAKPSLFSGSTSINYGITVDEHVSLKVYNAAGQAVRTLVNDNVKAGSYTASWDGRDDMGRQLSSGVYFTKLNTESISSSRKLVLR